MKGLHEIDYGGIKTRYENIWPHYRTIDVTFADLNVREIPADGFEIEI